MLDSVAYGGCYGFVEGIVAAEQMTHFQLSLKKQMDVRKFRFCPADGAELGDEVQIVVKYIEGYSPLGKLDKTLLVYSALMAAYPCKS